MRFEFERRLLRRERVRRGWSIIAWVLVGCASAPAKREPEQTEPPPIDRWETRARHQFVAVNDCDEAPLVAHLPAIDPAYARRVLLKVYSPRPLPLHATFFLDGRELHTLWWAATQEERARADAAQVRCREGRGTPKPVSVAAAASKVGAAHPRPAPLHHPPPPPTPSKPEAHAEVNVREVDAPPKHDRYIGFALAFWNGVLPERGPGDVYTESYSGHPMKGAIDVQLWGEDMLDLRDVTFEIEEQELVPLLPAAEYPRALQAQIDARLKEQPTKKEPRQGLLAQPATRPPPPPRDEARPPAPSEDAIWIAGSWRWSGADYEWVSGAWRIPPPAAKPPPPAPTPVKPPPAVARVAEAPPPPRVPEPPPPPAPVAPPPPVVAVKPPAPPPARTEEVPPAATPGAVWIPGYWAWTGQVYRWVPGRWQVPPSAAARWQPAQITVNAAGLTVEIPAGWVELGR